MGDKHKEWMIKTNRHAPLTNGHSGPTRVTLFTQDGMESIQAYMQSQRLLRVLVPATSPLVVRSTTREPNFKLVALLIISTVSTLTRNEIPPVQFRREKPFGTNCRPKNVKYSKMQPRKK